MLEHIGIVHFLLLNNLVPNISLNRTFFNVVN